MLPVTTSPKIQSATTVQAVDEIDTITEETIPIRPTSRAESLTDRAEAVTLRTVLPRQRVEHAVASVTQTDQATPKSLLRFVSSVGDNEDLKSQNSHSSTDFKSKPSPSLKTGSAARLTGRIETE